MMYKTHLAVFLFYGKGNIKQHSLSTRIFKRVLLRRTFSLQWESRQQRDWEHGHHAAIES